MDAVMDLNDMRMSQRGENLAFPLNASRDARLGNRLDCVEGDNSVQAVLASAIRDSHAISSDFLQDVVARGLIRVAIIPCGGRDTHGWISYCTCRAKASAAGRASGAKVTPRPGCVAGLLQWTFRPPLERLAAQGAIPAGAHRDP